MKTLLLTTLMLSQASAFATSYQFNNLDAYENLGQTNLLTGFGTMKAPLANRTFNIKSSVYTDYKLNSKFELEPRAMIYDLKVGQRLIKKGLVSDCKRYDKRNSIGRRVFSHYDCLDKQTLADDNSMKQSARALTTTLNFTGFTPSMSKVSLQATVAGNGLKKLGFSQTKYSFMGSGSVFACVDQYGKNWNISTMTNSIEDKIDELLNNGYEKYVRCRIHVGNLASSAALSHDAFTRSRKLEIELSQKSDNIVIHGESQQRHEFRKRGQQQAASAQQVARLNRVIDTYSDFLREDYGLLLAEIAFDRLSRAEANLKITRFLKDNKMTIKGHLDAIKGAMKPCPLFDQVAASFRLNRLYLQIAGIEESLNTVMSLESIVTRYY